MRPFGDFLVTKEFDQRRDLVTALKPATPAPPAVQITHLASAPGRLESHHLPGAPQRTSEEAAGVDRTTPGHRGQSEHCGRRTKSPTPQAKTERCNLRGYISHPRPGLPERRSGVPEPSCH